MQTIPTEARRLMDTYAHTARTTESDAVAEANISVLTGMIGYAVTCGHITAQQHSAEWRAITLIRDERAARRLRAA
jgi:hypothetical protein